MKARRSKTRDKASTRAPLSRDTIEHAALELIEREGLANFSMRKLGALVGVEAMSLYHHYPSKAHLLDTLLDRLISTVEVPSPPLPIRERLRRAGIAYRAVALRHPQFAQFVLLHRMNTAAGVSFLERLVKETDENLNLREFALVFLQQQLGTFARPRLAAPTHMGEAAEHGARGDASPESDPCESER